MKLCKLSEQTYLIRHWFRWYRVERGGRKWVRLPLVVNKSTLGPKDDVAYALSLLDKRVEKASAPTLLTK